MTFLELGITARSTYVQTEGNEIMPHLLDGGGGLRAATETVQTMFEDFILKSTGGQG